MKTRNILIIASLVVLLTGFAATYMIINAQSKQAEETDYEGEERDFVYFDQID